MNIIVLIKQVPDTTDVKIDSRTGTLIREGIPTIINPEDLHGLEQALLLRERFGGKVTAVTMGPPQAVDALQEAISMGVDEAVLLTDPAFAGADTLATAYTLGKCVERIGEYDLVICGRQAIDGDTAQVGPQVAEYLDIPQITYVSKIEIEKSKLISERAIEGGYERVECKLPALLTVVKELNTPRYPAVDRMMDACSEDAEIKFWNAGDIGAMADRIGLTGSPTMVKRTFTPDQKRKGETLSGDKDEAAQQLLERLKGKKII